MRTLIILFLLLFCFFSYSGGDSLAAFADKLKPLSGNNTLRADYRQIRHLKEMNFNMEIKGSMLLERDKRLMWKTHSPIRSATLISEKELKTWDEETGKVVTVSITDFPWLRSLFRTQALWTKGDLKELEEQFDVKIADEYTLKLIPRNTNRAVFFKQIQIRFSPDYSVVEKVEFLEKNGDTMILYFNKTENNAEIPEKEWKLPPQ